MIVSGPDECCQMTPSPYQGAAGASRRRVLLCRTGWRPGPSGPAVAMRAPFHSWITLIAASRRGAAPGGRARGGHSSRSPYHLSRARSLRSHRERARLGHVPTGRRPRGRGGPFMAWGPCAQGSFLPLFVPVCTWPGRRCAVPGAQCRCSLWRGLPPVGPTSRGCMGSSGCEGKVPSQARGRGAAPVPLHLGSVGVRAGGLSGGARGLCDGQGQTLPRGHGRERGGRPPAGRGRGRLTTVSLLPGPRCAGRGHSPLGPAVSALVAPGVRARVSLFGMSLQPASQTSRPGRRWRDVGVQPARGSLS